MPSFLSRFCYPVQTGRIYEYDVNLERLVGLGEFSKVNYMYLIRLQSRIKIESDTLILSGDTFTEPSAFLSAFWNNCFRAGSFLETDQFAFYDAGCPI